MTLSDELIGEVVAQRPDFVLAPSTAGVAPRLVAGAPPRRAAVPGEPR
jgi:hypothetical protein